MGFVLRDPLAQISYYAALSSILSAFALVYCLLCNFIYEMQMFTVCLSVCLFYVPLKFLVNSDEYLEAPPTFYCYL